KGYYIERSAIVRSEDLSESPGIEKILLGNDQIEIGQLALTSSKYEALKEKAVTAAVEAAKEKAERMVAVFPGLALGPVLTIREGNRLDNGPIRITENRIEMPAFNESEEPEFDLVRVTVSVSVRIALQ
ncbi:MAG: SIMPL domain-containing protein, partial [Verrucomicrobiota bacterium]